MRKIITAPARGRMVTVGIQTLTPSAGNLTADLAAANEFRVTLGSGALTLLIPIRSGSGVYDGDEFWLHVEQDATGGRLMLGFTPGTGGFVSNTAASIVFDGTALTRTSLHFRRVAGYWTPVGQATGLSIS